MFIGCSASESFDSTAKGKEPYLRLSEVLTPGERGFKLQHGGCPYRPALRFISAFKTERAFYSGVFTPFQLLHKLRCNKVLQVERLVPLFLSEHLAFFHHNLVQ